MYESNFNSVHVGHKRKSITLHSDVEIIYIIYGFSSLSIKVLKVLEPNFYVHREEIVSKETRTPSMYYLRFILFTFWDSVDHEGFVDDGIVVIPFPEYT